MVPLLRNYARQPPRPLDTTQPRDEKRVKIHSAVRSVAQRMLALMDRLPPATRHLMSSGPKAHASGGAYYLARTGALPLGY